MRHKVSMAFLALMAGLAIVAAPLAAQEKRSTPNRSPEQAAPRAEDKAAKPESLEKKPEGALARDLPCCANDFWITLTGGFHMAGGTGRGIYIYPVPNGTRYDTTWTFSDGRDVGGRSGWTYREDGFGFYMFFSRNASPNGKFEVLSSEDNRNFRHYGWAD
jgi:hypothetical protein